MAAEGTVVHAYGVVDGEVDFPPGAGIGGTDVSVLRCGDLAVLVGWLPAEAYGAEAWREHGQEPRWLGEVAEQHHAVIQGAADVTDVVPLRLPGVYPDEEALTAAIDAQRASLEGALGSVRGHVEWGVKVFAGAAAPAEPEPEPATTGRDYLRRRSEQASRREQARDRRRAAVLEVHETLAHSATRAVANPPQDSSLSGRPEPMLLNAAYLVPRASQEPFLDVAAQLAQQLESDGLTLEVTGPWPPYNFAGSEGEQP